MNLPSEIAANYVQIAKGKTTQVWWKTLILAVLAGAFIALGGAFATVAGSGYTGAQASLIKGAVFPLGLILVVICGAELFTGNCLLIAPLLKREVKVTGVLKNLGIVYCGNLIGAVLIALLVIFGDAYKDVAKAAMDLAAAKCTANFGYTLLRGILCNILVCLAVWGAMASKNAVGKVLIVYMPVFAFVACGFEHSVANMFYLSAGLLAQPVYNLAAVDGLNVGNAILYNLLPSTLGNIIGGMLIGVAYWAVYLTEKRKEN
ncbi:MAG: formate/nitrite transporter family protein [Clostridia bacterium]|nr:formate/nitrite transporter family protein [Clostridia bacterium]